jgi:uncharacterized protein YfaS (alpha-2-macroglobulin family)
VALGTAKQVVSVEPAVAFILQSNWRGVVLTGDFEPGRRYAVKVAQPPSGADANKFPRADTFSVLFPDRQSGAWFEHAEGYLGSAGNRTLLAHAVNLSSVKLQVHRVYDNNLVAWRNAGRSYRWRDPTPYAAPIATRKLEVAGQRNKVQDLRIALDELLPAGLSRDGVYRVILQTQDVGSVEETLGHRGWSRYGDFDDYDDDGGQTSSALVSLSDIALTAKQSRQSLVAWAVSLSTARPLSGVRVRAFSNKNQPLGEAITNGDGLATIEEIHPAQGEMAAVLLADFPGSPVAAVADQNPRGLTWLDLRSGNWGFGDSDLAGRPYQRQGCEAFVYADRGVYRPGETVHLRAIVRNPDHGTPAPFPLKWQIRRPDLRDWRSNVVMLDADGSCGWTLKLPDDLTTGRWSAHVGLAGEAARFFGDVSFQVEEFMPDRMKVGLKFDAPGAEADAPRYAVGDKPLGAVVQADYLFGRPAAGLRAMLHARIDRQGFSAKGYEGWTFGDLANLIEIPGTSQIGAVPVARPNAGGANSGEAVLDDNGSGKWQVKVDELLKLRSKPNAASDETDEEDADDANPAVAPATAAATQPALEYRGPWRLSVSASVAETGGRAVTASNSITVDVLPWYIGLRAGGTGTPWPDVPTSFEVALVGPSGKAATISAKLEAALYRQSYNSTFVFREGRYYYQCNRVLDPVTRGVPASVAVRQGKGALQLTIPDNGQYVLRVHDPASGAMSSMSFYVSDGTPWEDNVSRQNPEKLEVVLLGLEEAMATTRPATGPTTAAATKPALASGRGAEAKFQIGQRAAALVRSPFAGRLLLAVETDRVIATHVVDMPASQVTVPIDIPDACRPNAYVTATVVRAVQPNAKWRTHRAFGAARLNIDPADRKLDMQITMAGEVRPRSTLDVRVEVIDQHGSPVRNASLTLAAVDEGILQLTRFVTPDPLGFFNGKRALGVKSGDIYSHLMPEVPKADPLSSVGGDSSESARHRNPISARRVKPVALVSDVLRTDASGIATARFDVPEFAGKLRVMAVAHQDYRFGSAQNDVLVRSPLLLQSSLPRFAAPGDRFAVPVTVFNNSQQAGQALVKIELWGDGASPLKLADGKAWADARIDVPAGGQRVVSFELAAGQRVGVARVRLGGQLGDERFEENVELPVRPANPMITRGGFAVAEVGQPLKLEVPGGMLAGTQDLDIKVTPWPTLELPGGLEYLERYPYGCAEQTISTAFPLAYLGDIGAQIAPGVFAKQRVAEKLQAGVLRLIGMQTADGGIAMWNGDSRSWAWASVYAAHFIIEAEAAGHAIPADFRQRLLGYVRHLLEKDGDEGDLIEVQAYACYVLAMAGKPERAAMNRLTELAGRSGADALAQYQPQRDQARLWLAMAHLASGRRDLAQGMVPKVPPSPRTTRQLSGNIGSPIRDRALLVNTILAVQPDHPALPSLVQQLADSGRNGHWRSTQDSAFAVMALGKYIRQTAGDAPYHTAQLELSGERIAATEAGPILAFRAGIGVLAGGATTRPATRPSDGQFVVRLTGPAGARGHVTWSQNGVPLVPASETDSGIKIRRRYLDAAGKPLEGNAAQSGDLVRVEITVESTGAHENLVIEDLLPTGLEIENPRLATSAASAGNSNGEEPSDSRLASGRLDVRDDRLILVGSTAGAGYAKYLYLARATSLGTFVVPPVRCECMYDISIHSIASGGGTLVVKSAGTPAVARR